MPAPPAVVCVKWYVFDKRPRSAALATCSLFGPHARRSHSFISLRLYLVTEDSVDATRCSDIAGEGVCYFSRHFCDAHAPCGTVVSLRCKQLFFSLDVPVKNALVVRISKQLMTSLRTFSQLLHLVQEV